MLWTHGHNKFKYLKRNAEERSSAKEIGRHFRVQGTTEKGTSGASHRFEGQSVLQLFLLSECAQSGEGGDFKPQI